MREIKEIIKEISWDRTEEVESFLMTTNKDYIDLTRSITSLIYEIKDLLPKEKSKLIFDLESYVASQSLIQNEEIYKQGLRDGMKFINF
jgi:hypothetical protein